MKVILFGKTVKGGGRRRAVVPAAILILPVEVSDQDIFQLGLAINQAMGKEDYEQKGVRDLYDLIKEIVKE
jgi:hypothetical protein